MSRIGATQVSMRLFIIIYRGGERHHVELVIEGRERTSFVSLTPSLLFHIGIV